MASYSSKKYPSGSISTAQLADGTVTAVDLANNIITTDKLSDNAVTAGKMASGSALANIGSNTITSSKLASGAAIENMGYQPPLYVYGTFNATTSGRVWCRCAYFNNSRQGYLVTINTNGGYYGPTTHSFIVFKTWTNEIYVTNLAKPAGTYAVAARMQGAAADGSWYLEIQFDINPSQTVDAFRMGIMSLSHYSGDFLPQVGSYGTNAANLASTSNSVAI